MALPQGSRIGGYRILSVLGQGGMGVVYEAEDPKRGRRVALKVLSPSLASDEAFLVRFRREVRAGEAIAHPNVVALLDSGEDGPPFLVFELVRGGTLKQRLAARERLGWREAAAVGAGIARGLAAVHAAGLVHRDLKPENVLLAEASRGQPETPKVSDFGLVGAHGSALAVSSALTSTGELVGTLEYMAPEQANAARGVTKAADLYSLGAVLYALVAGRPPFQGVGYGLVKKHLVERPRPLRERASDVPPPLELLVARLLEKDPAARPSSAIAVANELEAIARHAGRGSGAKLIVPLALGALLAGIGTGVAWVALARTSEPEKLEAEPPGPRALDLVKQADALREKGKLDEALALASRALALDSKLALAWATRGHVRLDRKDADGAIADYTRAVELDPRLSVAWANRGALKAGKGDLAGAVFDLTHAVELSPNDALLVASRAELRRRLGEIEGAIADATRAIGLDPKLPQAWLNRGSARVARGDRQEAVLDFTRAIDLDPKLVVAWRLRAEARRNLRDDDGAIADATRALELDPEDAGAWTQRGAAHLGKRESEAAAADLTRAIELDPKDGLPHSLRGVARANMGDSNGALVDLTRAVELDAKDVGAYRNRAVVRSNTGDKDGAIADYSKALEIEPKDAISWRERGILHERRGERKEAIADLTRAVELEPKDALAWANRGDARAKERDHEGAVSDFTRALELDPRDTFSLATRGESRQQLGDFAGAIADFGRFLELAPDDPNAKVVRAAKKALEDGNR